MLSVRLFLLGSDLCELLQGTHAICLFWFGFATAQIKFDTEM